MRRAGPWLLGLLAGLVLLGPLLGPGSLLNLDLVLIDPIPVPAGAWGLGPELPRRVPFMIPVAWIGAFAGSWLATRALLLGIFVTATVGLYRAGAGLPAPVRYGLALVYGAGPFLVTRVGVGHLSIAAAAALLPWVLPTLLRPTRRPEATVLGATALGLTGVTGGIYAGLAVVTGLLADRPPPRDTARTLGLVAVTQLPWLAPGLIVYSQGVEPSSSVLFGARVRSPLDGFRLLVGHGFWQDRFQVGFDRLDALLIGVVLGVLAVLGARHLPEPWRGRGAVLAAVAALLVVAGAVPWVDDRIADLAGFPPFAPLREAHRLLPLALVWVLLAAGQGVVRSARVVADQWRPALVATPIALGLVLAGSGAWGLGQDLRPYDLDDDWGEARALIGADAGSVVALPWAQYLDVAEFDDRRVHHPAPFALSADVIVSSDPRLGGRAQERTDEREPAVDALVEDLRRGRPAAAGLAELGVRWVLILKTVDWEAYTGLDRDPGLDQVIDGEVLDLYRVDARAGPVVTPAGDVDPEWVVRPLGRVDAPAGGTWLTTGAWGWVRGLTALGDDGPGRLHLPGGGGLLWYWPAVAVILADVVALLVAVIAALRLVRGRRAPPDGPARP